MTRDEIEFNHHTMIQAGTLRQAGFPIPENIPDCAWTYREELELNCNEADGHCENGMLCVNVSVKCGAFHWVEGAVTSLPMKVKCE